MVKTNPLELDRKKQGKVTKQLAKITLQITEINL